jgi:hypothetical protein
MIAAAAITCGGIKLVIFEVNPEKTPLLLAAALSTSFAAVEPAFPIPLPARSAAAAVSAKAATAPADDPVIIALTILSAMVSPPR